MKRHLFSCMVGSILFLIVSAIIVVGVLIHLVGRIDDVDDQLQIIGTLNAGILTGTPKPTNTPAPIPTETPPTACIGTIRGVRVPLRTFYDNGASYQAIVDLGEPVEILSVLSTNDWYYVRYKGNYGWVELAYITPGESCYSVPAVDPYASPN